MQRDIAVATRSFRVTIDEEKVAHIVFGPAGAMPVTDAAGNAALGSIWSELDAHPDVRAILVRSEGKGCCAGGESSMVEEMLGSEAARTRVMREARDESPRVSWRPVSVSQAGTALTSSCCAVM
jgi:enoyl-CoA hydratase